jgi:sugar lactone lactonase YvrE
VAVGNDGTVYVSDMMGNRIHAVKDGKVSVFAEGEEMEYPNGLLVENGRLIVAAWGKPEADFTTKIPGRLFALDLNTRQKTLITPEPIGNLDGVESDGQGGYIVTDWVAGKVLRVMADGSVQPLKEFMPGTADIAFLPAQNLLILPHMNENKVAAYELTN